jgi:hypothetical protein
MLTCRVKPNNVKLVFTASQQNIQYVGVWLAWIEDNVSE